MTNTGSLNESCVMSHEVVQSAQHFELSQLLQIESGAKWLHTHTHTHTKATLEHIEASTK